MTRIYKSMAPMFGAITRENRIGYWQPGRPSLRWQGINEETQLTTRKRYSAPARYAASINKADVNASGDKRPPAMPYATSRAQASYL